MSTCVEDYDEELHDDPIKLCFKTHHSNSCCYLGSSINKEVGNMPPKPQIETIDLTGTSDTTDIKVPKQLSTKDDVCYQIKQLAIEIVDFRKFPSYYKKSIKYYDNTESSSITNGIVICGDQNNTNVKCMKIKYDTDKGQWKVQERKAKSSPHIKDRVIPETKFQRNLNIIDFKRNKGLVGLTITQKFVAKDIVVKKEKETSSLVELDSEGDVVIDKPVDINVLPNKNNEITKEHSVKMTVKEKSGDSIGIEYDSYKLTEKFQKICSDANKPQPTGLSKKSSKDITNLKRAPQKKEVHSLVETDNLEHYAKLVNDRLFSGTPSESLSTNKNKETDILCLPKCVAETNERLQKRDNKKERNLSIDIKVRENKNKIDKKEQKKMNYSSVVGTKNDTIKVRKDIFNEVKSVSERKVAVINSTSKQFRNIKKFVDKVTKLAPQNKLRGANTEGTKCNEPKPLDMPILTEECDRKSAETSDRRMDIKSAEPSDRRTDIKSAEPSDRRMDRKSAEPSDRRTERKSAEPSDRRTDRKSAQPSDRRTSFKDSIVFENDEAGTEIFDYQEPLKKSYTVSSNQQTLERKSSEVQKSLQMNHSKLSVAENITTTTTTNSITIVPINTHTIPVVSYINTGASKPRIKYTPVTKDYTIPVSHNVTTNQVTCVRPSQQTPLPYPSAVNNVGQNIQNRHIIQLLGAPPNPPRIAPIQHRLPLQAMPQYNAPPPPPSYPSNYPRLPSYTTAVTNSQLAPGYRTYGNNCEVNSNFHYVYPGYGTPQQLPPPQPQVSQWQPNLNYSQNQPLHYQTNLHYPNTSSSGWNIGYAGGINNVVSSSAYIAANSTAENQSASLDSQRAYPQAEAIVGAKLPKNKTPKTRTPKNTNKNNVSLERVNELVVLNSGSAQISLKRPYDYCAQVEKRVPSSVLETELSKRPRTAPLVAMNENSRKVKPSGYSPPVLPIPTYETILSSFFSPRQSSETTQENAQTDAKAKCARRIPSGPVDKSRKISIEDYKKRICKNDSADLCSLAVRSAGNTKGSGHEPNNATMKLKCGNYYLEQDLGYSSDTTVKL